MKTGLMSSAYVGYYSDNTIILLVLYLWESAKQVDLKTQEKWFKGGKFQKISSRFFFPNSFIEYFLYLLKSYPLYQFPSGNLVSHSPPSAFMRVSPHTHTHYPLSHTCPGFSLYWRIQPSQDQGLLSSHWCLTSPSSATYAAGAIGSSMSTLWLVVWVMCVWGFWLVDVLPMGLPTLQLLQSFL